VTRKKVPSRSGPILSPAAASFDKYSYYRRAVQSPDVDVRFLRDTYRELKKREPLSLREDFCGTFAISCEWAKLSSKTLAYGVDLDPEPIAYGREHYLAALKPATRERVRIREANVLDPGVPKVDIVAAMNFSHFIFKDRLAMKSYFKTILATVSEGGIFVADCFGGPACQKPSRDVIKHKGFSYVWEQESYDPVNCEALFHIHFNVKDRKGKVTRHNKQFTYDWRMWSILELRELMLESGFKQTHVYWEGTTRGGSGDGIFTRVEQGEVCEAWVAYVVGEK
jgi:hypothetical protein